MYGCNGKCCDRVIDPETGEGQYFICGGIDTCDETRVGEFIGTVGAVLFIVMAPIMLIADRIIDMVQRMDEEARAEGKELVLLCYEDVRVPGDWCHRTVFAEWWAEQTGELIEELYDPSEPKVKKPAVKKESKEPVKKAVEARKEEPGYEQLSLFGLAGI